MFALPVASSKRDPSNCTVGLLCNVLCAQSCVSVCVCLCVCVCVCVCVCGHGILVSKKTHSVPL